MRKIKTFGCVVLAVVLVTGFALVSVPEVTVPICGASVGDIIIDVRTSVNSDTYYLSTPFSLEVGEEILVTMEADEPAAISLMDCRQYLAFYSYQQGESQTGWGTCGGDFDITYTRFTHKHGAYRENPYLIVIEPRGRKIRNVALTVTVISEPEPTRLTPTLTPVAKPVITPTPTPQVEKDLDGDGVPDEYDYAPYDPEVQTKGDVKSPGFGAIFAIAGLLTVVYLLRKRE